MGKPLRVSKREEQHDKLLCTDWYRCIERSTKHSAWAEFVRDLADRKLLDSAIEPGPVKETIDNLIRLGDIGPLCFFVIFCHLAKPQETPELRRVVEKVTRKLQELAKNECLPQPEKDMVLVSRSPFRHGTVSGS